MDKYAAQVEEFMKLCFPNGLSGTEFADGRWCGQKVLGGSER